MVAAVAGSASVLAIAPAHAVNWDWGPWYEKYAGYDAGATAYFEEHGDRLKLCDTSTDGYRAHVRVESNRTSNLVYRFSDTYDNGRCSYIDANDRSYSNLRENTWYTIWVGEGTSSVTRNWKPYEIYNDH
ncbi:hypothetical protein RM572_27770 [Streptomyces sp. DSM 42041]|uniref:Uncharacterized protein n=1 Tax=Streptomyces hazeniae TaxID=3075538 RepID=A0ABU2NZZ0_9ACTN|nr:hypothetical protein [Streptomyces sp. DSM 42041]MDT0382561.1 hypothetical protein [Streptomyces sp. DSM 42041]